MILKNDLKLRQCSGDDDFLHVAGALINLADPHIAVDPLHRKIADITITAQGLDRHAADLFSHFTGKQLGHGGFFQAGTACIAQSGSMPDQLPCGFNLRCAIGQSEANSLVVENGLPKTLALLGVAQSALKRATRHAHALRDAGRPCLKEAAMAKLFASEMAEQVCSAAIQTLGGYGYVSDFPVERIYRDVRVCQIYEGTSDVQKIIIQRALA